MVEALDVVSICVSCKKMQFFLNMRELINFFVVTTYYIKMPQSCKN